ncbi:MAG: hypothetical protein OEV41_11040 [Gammaproteobacteria bacterium]|nr:hypothetical protein [Gammaproteobacteria bacterium]
MASILLQLAGLDALQADPYAQWDASHGILHVALGMTHPAVSTRVGIGGRTCKRQTSPQWRQRTVIGRRRSP